MPDLTAAQIRKLKARAQKLDPSLRVGRQGVTDAFVKAADEVLAHHELIKVRFDEFKDQKDTLAEEIARRTQSAYLWRVGHVVLLYRQHPDPEHRKIQV